MPKIEMIVCDVCGGQSTYVPSVSCLLPSKKGPIILSISLSGVNQSSGGNWWPNHDVVVCKECSIAVVKLIGLTPVVEWGCDEADELVGQAIHAGNKLVSDKGRSTRN